MVGGISNQRFVLGTHRDFGVTVAVTLVLNEGGSQHLQLGVGLAEVLHRRGHVQGGDPTEGTHQLSMRTHKNTTRLHRFVEQNL